jgi:hypothetical protein
MIKIRETLGERPDISKTKNTHLAAKHALAAKFALGRKYALGSVIRTWQRLI